MILKKNSKEDKTDKDEERYLASKKNKKWNEPEDPNKWESDLQN